MPGWIETPGRCCVLPGLAGGGGQGKKVRGQGPGPGPTPLTQLPSRAAHLLGVAGWDLLEALAGLPESHVLRAELLLQELLGGGGAGRLSDTETGGCVCSKRLGQTQGQETSQTDRARQTDGCRSGGTQRK